MHQIFRWIPVEGAESYDFHLYDKNDVETASVIVPWSDATDSAVKLEMVISRPGEYKWRVASSPQAVRE